MNNQTSFQCKSVLQRVAILCATMFFLSAAYAHEQVKVVVVPLAGDDLRTVYEIGKTGPAGGVVFHVTDGGLHGLEASHEDQSSGAVWCGSLSNITDIADLTNGGAVDPNTGAHNTQAILDDGCGARSAAGVASSYEGPNGKTMGWYLPNKEELDLLYEQRVVVGGFASTFYWSSSEFGYGIAWGQYFDDGSQGDGPKDGGGRVRAVRAF